MLSRGPNFTRLKDETAGTNNFADEGLHAKGRWSKPSSIVVILVSLHGAATWRGRQRCTREATINTSDADTPRWKNGTRQTVYDAVVLDYEKVTVLIDATAAERPAIHLASIRDMRTIGVETSTLEEWFILGTDIHA